MNDFLVELLNKTHMDQKKLCEDIDSRYNDLIITIEQSLQCITHLQNTSEIEVFPVLCELLSRAHKTTHALILLCYSGFELQSLSSLRDLVETHYLIVYFMMKPKEMDHWFNSDYKERKKKYSPPILRKIISANNSSLKQSLDQDYSGHSTFTHITPELLKVQNGTNVDKNNERDRRFARVCLTDIAYHIQAIAYASSHFGWAITQDDSFNKNTLKLKELNKIISAYQMMGTIPLLEYLEKGNSLSKV